MQYLVIAAMLVWLILGEITCSKDKLLKTELKTLSNYSTAAASFIAVLSRLLWPFKAIFKAFLRNWNVDHRYI